MVLFHLIVFKNKFSKRCNLIIGIQSIIGMINHSFVIKLLIVDLPLKNMSTKYFELKYMSPQHPSYPIIMLPSLGMHLQK